MWPAIWRSFLATEKKYLNWEGGASKYPQQALFRYIFSLQYLSSTEQAGWMTLKCFNNAPAPLSHLFFSRTAFECSHFLARMNELSVLRFPHRMFATFRTRPCYPRACLFYDINRALEGVLNGRLKLLVQWLATDGQYHLFWPSLLAWVRPNFRLLASAVTSGIQPILPIARRR